MGKMDELQAQLAAEIEKAGGKVPGKGGVQSRWPAGNPKGGQFAPKGTAGGGLVAPQFAQGGKWNSSHWNDHAPKDPPHTINKPGSSKHPGKDDKGRDVFVHKPTQPSAPASWHDPKATATFTPNGATPAHINGLAFTHWSPPTSKAGWAAVAGQDASIDDHLPFTPIQGKSIGAGVAIIEPDGRIWLTKPTNEFGNYVHTFPKGTIEKDLSMQANAIKEAYEETGLKVKITGVLGDFERDTSKARIYLAERVAGTPKDMGWESQAVRLVPTGQAKDLLNKGHDKNIAELLHNELNGIIKAANPGGPAKAGNHHAALQDRWPAGTPLGGQWKSMGGNGITLPPNIAGGDSGKNPVYAKKAKAMHQLASEGDKAGLAAALAAVDAKVAASASKPKTNSHDKWYAQLQQYGQQVMKDTEAVPQAKAAGEKAAGPLKLSDMTYHGAKPGGSSAGAIYTDKDGQKWLIKSYGAVGMAQNEVVAANLLHAMGAGAPEMRLVDLGDKFNGGTGVASKWLDASDGVVKFDKSNPIHIKAAQADFAAHAFLANWDVVGMAYDNLMFNKATGTIINIDPGGALEFRAQGGLKGGDFGTKVGELSTMKDPAKNAQTGHVFGSMTLKDMQQSAEKVAGLSDVTIAKIVAGMPNKSTTEKMELIAKLIKRKEHLLSTLGGQASLGGEPTITEGKPKLAHPAIAAYQQKMAANGVKTITHEGKQYYVLGTGATNAEGKVLAHLASTTEGKIQLNGFNPAQSQQHIDPALVGKPAAQQSTITPAVKTVALENILTPAGVISAKALKGEGAIWASQDNFQSLAYSAKNSFNGEGPNPASVKQFEIVMAAKAAGFIGGYKKASGGYQQAYFLYNKEGQVLTKEGAEALHAAYKAQTAPAAAVTQANAVKAPEVPKFVGSAKAIFAEKAGAFLAEAKAGNLEPAKFVAGASASASVDGQAYHQFAQQVVAHYTGAKAEPAAAAPKPVEATPQVKAARTAGPALAPLAMPAKPAKEVLSSAANKNTKLLAQVNAMELVAQGYAKGGFSKEEALDAIGSAKFGTNTYGKKAAAYQASLVAAISGSATAPAVPAAEPPVVKPSTPAAQKAAAAKPKKAWSESMVSAPPDFMNWGGTGKMGPSSMEAKNQANQAGAQAIYAAAKGGDEKAIHDLKLPVLNAKGQLEYKPVLDHPSQHIKGYAQQVLNEIDAFKNPPKQFRISSDNPIAALHAAAPIYTGSVAAPGLKKIGNYVVVGNPGSFDTSVLGLEKKSFSNGKLKTGKSGTYAAAALAAYHKMPATQLQALEAYTGPDYKTMNPSLWKGNPSGLAKSAVEAVQTLGHSLEPGTVLSRKITVTEETAKAIASSVGKVLQEPALASTAINPEKWGGNVHYKMTIGPGVKGLYVDYGSMPNGGAISSNSGETEIMLPANTRMLVQKAYKTSTPDADGFGGYGKWTVEVLILPNDTH